MVDHDDMEERLVRILKQEGLLRTRPRSAPIAYGLAAALLIFALGGVTGSALARRNSLEALLDRQEMSLPDRVLLMQRAGTAYVRAAHQYAVSAKSVDSTAVEVASRVLMGAANAVARSDLDGGLTPRLVNVLTPVLQPQIIRY